MKSVEEIKPNFAPFYVAGMYPELCKIFQKHGYALAVHGSMAKDFDLIAVPWVARPHMPSTVIKAITKRFAIDMPVTKEIKKHGRIAYELHVSFGECRLDLSFFPAPLLLGK